MKTFFFLIAAVLSFNTAYPAWLIQNGKFIDADLALTASLEKHYSDACQDYENQRWEKALKNFAIVSYNFPKTQEGMESFFYEGVCYFEMKEYDYADDFFNEYLHMCSHPKYFQETMQYKFFIANEFLCGAKKRLLGTKRLPKWGNGEELALKIYDDIIQSIPCHDFAAESLYAKGYLLCRHGYYQDSIESFQTLIRRFPKHELAPLSYIAITRVYLEECQYEYQNPDLLELAQINLRRFKQEFPRDENIALAEEDVRLLKEAYAKGFYQTAQLYEWRGSPDAAVIYYMNAITQYPDTEIARTCRDCILRLKPCLLDPALCKKKKDDEPSVKNQS